MFELGSFGGTYWRPIQSSVTGKDYKNQHKKYPTSWWKGIPDDHLTRVFEEYSVKINRYGVKVGTTLEYWEDKGWIKPSQPYGWVQWYCDFFQGKRGEDDERQITRWAALTGPNGRFRNWLINEIQRKGKNWDDEGVSPAKRQTLQHWGYRLTKADYDSKKKRGGTRRQTRSSNGRRTLRASLGRYGRVTVTPTTPPTLVYDLRGLAEGAHGFHIHEKGIQEYGKACDAAGAHFNPDNNTHGGPASKERHGGDLGNVIANAKGIARGEKVLDVKDSDELVGRSVIVHDLKDDLGYGRGVRRRESLKTGNAGARLACGVLYPY
jgi:Cu/Zn superoxide dismutase